MSDDIVVTAVVAQQIADILKQSFDPEIQQLADIINPPPPVPVLSILESVTDIINLGNPVTVSGIDTAVSVLFYISNRLTEILSSSVPADFSAQIINIIKNG
jgi:hypothetical protein